MPSDSFSKLFLAAVDESLLSLGNSSKQAVFFHLEASFNIKKENIPSNLTGFSKALEGIFGSGASYLEELIAKRLHEKLGVAYEEKMDPCFPERVVALKKHATTRGGATR